MSSSRFNHFIAGSRDCSSLKRDPYRLSDTVSLVTLYARDNLEKLNVKSGTSTFLLLLFIIPGDYFFSSFFLFSPVPAPCLSPSYRRNEFLAAHEYPSANHNEESSVRDNLKRIIQPLVQSRPHREKLLLDYWRVNTQTILCILFLPPPCVAAEDPSCFPLLSFLLSE